MEGVRGALKENVEAWLGEQPETERERSNFIASADEKVRSSLKALGYYRPEIVIAVDRTTEPWKMLVEAAQKQPVLISEIDIQLLEAATDDPAFVSLAKTLPFSVGDTLNHGVYDKFKKQLSALGQQRGYFDGSLKLARIEVNADASTAKIVVHYSSGQRYRIGNVKLDEAILDTSWFDSVLNFRTGDWFDWTPLQQLRSELQQTRYYSSVTVKPLIDKRDNGEVPVVVELSPVDRHSFEFGVGYSTDTEERVSVGWKTPLTHPRNDVLQFSAYLADKEFGDITSLQKGVQVRREIGSTGNPVGRG